MQRIEPLNGHSLSRRVIAVGSTEIRIEILAQRSQANQWMASGCCALQTVCELVMAVTSLKLPVKRRYLIGGNWPDSGRSLRPIFFASPIFILPTSATTAQ
jgi:hypothetical protein